ncbi:thioredoxin-disulfide reductase [Phototrophicus methaneseepsis]|uniref:Thioredoxin reductase n=1 Tax=Phototrophicus methaneseepsis TaxID=2710758 RepID=A0A7S8IF78_9CHLR|nr:thioredoxin-disulfide reductase [Phototrophicus methaneseepsis]QPC83234.1 thioredoxin-disulfide reductase [Phototrophicus methaneseepsis]
MKKERVVIIGSGPAGLAAALYTARAQLNPVVIVGNQLGGQAAITHEIENYPGFPGGLSGPDLVEKMKEHAESFGATFTYDLVESVDFSSGSPYTVKTLMDEYSADSVIVTIGADPRKLGIPGENEGVGKGVSYCGTCDGFFFRGKDIVVVGGGDSALEEAIFLTRFANSVTIIHRREELRAGVQLQKRALNNEKISFIWNTVIDKVNFGDDGQVNGVTLNNVETGEVTEHPTEGVFIFIGHVPNSPIFGDQLAMNERGYIITDERMRTSVPGVFAAGEIQDEIWRQVATSVGQGTSAAMTAIHWLEANEETLQPLDETAEPAGD